MATTPSVVINKPVRDFLLMDPSGPVQLDMLRRANNVLFSAQTLCPQFESTLIDSLHIAPTSLNNMPGFKVGSDLSYAIYVDQGTGPAAGHGDYQNMPPVDKPEFAAWAADKGVDPFVLARHIFFNGTEPTYFLTRSLEAATN